MQLFNETLTGGTRGGFDSEVGTGAEAPSFLGSVFTAAIPVTDTTGCYVEEAVIASTRSIVVKFQFQVPTSIQIGGAVGRTLNICSLVDGGQYALRLRLRNSVGTNIDQVSAIYQLAAGGAGGGVADVSILPDTWYTCEITYIAATRTSARYDGVFRIRVDDVTPGVLRDVVTGTMPGQNMSRLLVDTVRIGNEAGASSNTVDRTVLFRNVVFSPTDSHSATPETFYVDPELGDDINSGSSASPLHSAALIAAHLQAGETLVLRNKAGYPHRLHGLMDGYFQIERSGTAGSPITITNDTGRDDKTTVICSAKVGGDSPLQWAASDVAGAFYVTRGAGGDPLWGTIYTALSTSGSPSVRIGNSALAFEDYDALYWEDRAASVAAIAEGEWAWGDGTNETPALGYSTLYYRPVGGVITGIIAEIVAANILATDNVHLQSSDYVTVNNLKVRGAPHGIVSGGANCRIEYNDCGYGLIAGINIDGASVAYRNEVHHNQTRKLSVTKANPENGGGILCTGAAVSRIEGNYIHDNGDDGIEFDGTGESIAVGNLILDCGYNSTDGMGIETGTKAVSYKMYNNTIMGCVKGINCKTTAAAVIRNNAAFNNGTYGIEVNPTAIAIGSHNVSDQFQFSGSYTEDVVGSDVLVAGDYSALVNADGTIPAGSGLIAAGTKWWTDGNRPRGADGEPFLDNPDVGGIQSKHSINHPSNL